MEEITETSGLDRPLRLSTLQNSLFLDYMESGNWAEDSRQYSGRFDYGKDWEQYKLSNKPTRPLKPVLNTMFVQVCFQTDQIDRNKQDKRGVGQKSDPPLVLEAVKKLTVEKVNNTVEYAEGRKRPEEGIDPQRQTPPQLDRGIEDNLD